MGVAARGSVNWGSDAWSFRAYDDGLGTRRLHTDADGSTVEVLDVSPNLAADVAFEGALRARAARLSESQVEGVARVRRVERRSTMLQVVAEHVKGLRLPEFLQETIKGNIPLPQHAALELAGRILRIASALHQLPGMSHGSITPAHVVITRGAGVVLTDAVFGPAIEGLQRNRQQLWREFRLALPASASLPRFDQRADVTQLGATVLAVALGRPLRASEYPRSINEAVIAATLAARPGETGTSTSALRMWLQEALHLHPRATFSSAIDAEAAYAGVLGVAAARRGGSAAFEECVARVFGDTRASAEAAALANAWSHPAAVHHITRPIAPGAPAIAHMPGPAATRAQTAKALASRLRSAFGSLAPRA